MNALTIAAGWHHWQMRRISGKESCQSSRRESARKKELARLGFVFGDSKTNFIFAAHKTVPAQELFEALRASRIYAALE